MFGAETISSPNQLNFDTINLNPRQNIGVIGLLTGMTVLFILLACFSRYLDLNDLKFSSSIPLCGPDGPFTYEITIKTGSGVCGHPIEVYKLCWSGSRARGQKEVFQKSFI